MTAYEIRRRLETQIKEISELAENAERYLKATNAEYCDMDLTKITEPLNSTDHCEVESVQTLAAFNAQMPQMKELLELGDDELVAAVGELMGS